MRTATVIRAEITAEQELYRANVDTWNRVQVEESTNKVVTLQAELSGKLSEGADNCPHCGNKPHGMLRKEWQEKSLTFRIFEVGCTVCPPVPIEGQNLQTNIGAQGTSVEEAVSKWNNGEYFTSEPRQ